MISRSDEPRILMQFHITGRCNLRCKHCYINDKCIDDIKLEKVIDVINQFIELKQKFNSDRHITRKGHINITGGEPFIHSNIVEILRYLGEKRDDISYGVLSNGSFITSEIIDILKETGCTHVQLSIDGNQKYHDNIRGIGDYKRVLDKAKEISEAGIDVHISYTANSENIKYIPLVAKECKKIGVKKLWSDRMLPIGNASDSEMCNTCITSDNLIKYLQYLDRAKKRTGNNKGDFEVKMNRALQFMYGGEPYKCSAGKELIVVDENGNILPCRRLPIICGNVYETTLTDIYYNDSIFNQLREPKIPNECKECTNKFICLGGAKCQAYASYGNIVRADSACYKRQLN